ncbi:MAG: hypothetical protein A3J79_06880 [Elusimicrobia bacterium RIFOXYB2_FULL_62_6]|nr:MAG: hypothetical protein A3J79_06880 [Elusimicrobia bacterium RIFOXYB2_FULL_62_6]
MPTFGEGKKRALLRLSRLAALILLPAGALAYAGSLISAQYNISLPGMANGGANTASANYRIQNGVLGNSGGFVIQAAALANLPAADLSDAYVYPNPFKPNSPGSFQAAKITFKHLPAEATIRIFAITGKEAAKLHKTDTLVDYYEWNAVNDGGQKLASGVYIYLITAPGVGRAKGKFAVIR